MWINRTRREIDEVAPTAFRLATSDFDTRTSAVVVLVILIYRMKKKAPK